MTKAVISVFTIARICHEANRAYCVGIGDYSQRSWDEAPDWQRRSAIDGVVFHMTNPDASVSASHENWMRHKLAEGWAHGEVKNEEKKEHPCLVPWEKLPPAQQIKDHLFKAIVEAALAAAEVA